MFVVGCFVGYDGRKLGLSIVFRRDEVFHAVDDRAWIERMRHRANLALGLDFDFVGLTGERTIFGSNS